MCCDICKTKQAMSHHVHKRAAANRTPIYLIKKGDVQDWNSLIAQKCGLNLSQPFRRGLIGFTQLLAVSYVGVLLLASRHYVPFRIRIGIKPLCKQSIICQPCT